jgi:hypothetical protein
VRYQQPLVEAAEPSLAVGQVDLDAPVFGLPVGIRVAHARRVGRADPIKILVAWKITGAELAAANRYEVSDYRQIEVVLKSGVSAWVYVKAS